MKSLNILIVLIVLTVAFFGCGEKKKVGFDLKDQISLAENMNSFIQAVSHKDLDKEMDFRIGDVAWYNMDTSGIPSLISHDLSLGEIADLYDLKFDILMVKNRWIRGLSSTRFGGKNDYAKGNMIDLFVNQEGKIDRILCYQPWQLGEMDSVSVNVESIYMDENEEGGELQMINPDSFKNIYQLISDEKEFFAE